MSIELGWALYSLGYVVLAMLILVVAKQAFAKLAPYAVDGQLTEKDNPAVGVVLMGYLAGVAAVLCGLFAGPSGVLPDLAQFGAELAEIAIYGVVAMVCLFISGRLNDRLVLPAINNRKAISEDRNVAVGTVVGATYIASALVIAGGIYGSVDILTFAVAYLLGQLALVVYGVVYQKITAHDDQEELGEKKNLAAALGFAGHLIAFSLILFRGLRVNADDILEWTLADRATNFAYFAITGLVFLAVMRVAADRLFMPGAKLHDEITRDQNLNAGILEGGLALAGGVILVFCL